MASELRRLLGSPDRTLDVARGERVFHRGAPAAAIFGVDRGRIRLERSLADGSVLVFATLTSGSGLAEAAITSDVYHCDAVAEVASRLAVYDADRLRRRLESEPELARGWLARSTRQVRELRALLELRSIRPLTERVVAWLRFRDDGLASPVESDRPLRALADDLGVTPEALYRTLADLEAAKRIERRGRRIDLRSQPYT